MCGLAKLGVCVCASFTMPHYVLPTEYDHIFGNLVCHVLRRHPTTGLVTLAAHTKDYEGTTLQVCTTDKRPDMHLREASATIADTFLALQASLRASCC